MSSRKRCYISKMQIRLKVKEVATQQGFNQSSLSRAANVDFKTVKRIFQDPTRDVSLSTIVKIAWALNVPLGELLEVSGEPHSRLSINDAEL